MKTRPLVPFMATLNVTIVICLVMANTCNTFPSHNPALWKYLEALGNDELAHDYPFQVDPDTGKQKRMIKDQEDDKNIHGVLGLTGVHFIQKKKPSSNDSSISEEEKLEWMIEVMANIEALRSKIPPPRRFGKRSMIVGGSWG